MNPVSMRSLVEAVADTIVAHAEELTELDRAIGDGDHGINMKRGFDAVRATLDDLAAKPPPLALQALGMTLIMKVGGASGPLYGTLFRELGKRLGDAPSGGDAVQAFAGAIAAVQTLGKSQPGQKTLLDVLVPVLHALEPDPAAALPGLAATAHAAAAATVPMQAIRGRASFLGERSIGHMDPGARSSALMVEAVSGVLLGAAAAGAAP